MLSYSSLTAGRCLLRDRVTAGLARDGALRPRDLSSSCIAASDVLGEGNQAGLGGNAGPLGVGGRSAGTAGGEEVDVVGDQERFGDEERTVSPSSLVLVLTHFLARGLMGVEVQTESSSYTATLFLTDG